MKNSVLALDILGKLLLRTSSYKDEKELEIENLNGKIIYLLSELDIYRKNINLNKDNNNSGNKNEIVMLNNQLGLKDDEINRLNKDIDDLLTKIKELSCENNLLKNKNNKNNIKEKVNNISKKNDINNKSNNNNYNNKYNYSKMNNNVNTYKINNNINENKNYKKEYNENESSNDYSKNSNNSENDNNISDEEIENDLIKNQNDIEKIESQLRELNERETQNRK